MREGRGARQEWREGRGARDQPASAVWRPAHIVEADDAAEVGEEFRSGHMQTSVEER